MLNAILAASFNFKLWSFLSTTPAPAILYKYFIVFMPQMLRIFYHQINHKRDILCHHSIEINLLLHCVTLFFPFFLWYPIKIIQKTFRHTHKKKERNINYNSFSFSSAAAKKKNFFSDGRKKKTIYLYWMRNFK